MSAPEIDWQRQTEEFGRKGPAQAVAVAQASGQAADLRGTPEYWEAVYTLARQAFDMAGASEVQA